MRKMKLPKIVGNLLDSHLEIFSLPQGIENSRQFLLFRTDILQKIVVGYPGRVKEVVFLQGS